MLDIKFVRENPEIVKENIKKKFQDQKLPMVDEVIELDRLNRAAITEASDLRAKKNQLSKANGPLFGKLKKASEEEKNGHCCHGKGHCRKEEGEGCCKEEGKDCDCGGNCDLSAWRARRARRAIGYGQADLQSGPCDRLGTDHARCPSGSRGKAQRSKGHGKSGQTKEKEA